MQRRLAALLATCLLLLIGPNVSAEEEPAPDVGKVLAKVDAKLFFHDAQAGLLGYETKLLVDSQMGFGGMPAAPSEGKPDGKLTFDAEKGKSQTDAEGEKVAPGSVQPFCGPWTLTHVLAFEVELFAKPLAKRFPAEAWERKVMDTDAGRRILLKPKAKPTGEPLAPKVAGVVLELDADHLLTGAEILLQQDVMEEWGRLTFTYAAEGEKKRIAKIENELSSANLKIRPRVTFTFADAGGFTLPKTIEIAVSGADLSGAMRGMNPKTVRTFAAYEVRKAE